MTMAKRRGIRVGVIGCGRIARTMHVPRLNAIRGVKVTALFGRSRERVEAFRADCAPDADIYDDLDAMLASGLDAVTVCTPNHLHAAQSVKALRAGLHVMCEKPMAGTVRDATRMIAAARKAGKVLHINHTLRYHPMYKLLARLCRPERIGKLIHVRRLSAGVANPAMMEPNQKWFFEKASQGGVVLDLGIHMADIMLWIGGPITEVAAFADSRMEESDATDNAGALFRYRNGATGVLELSWTTPAGGSLIEVYGEKGRVRMGFSDKALELTRATSRGSRTTLHTPVKRGRSSWQAFVDAIRGKAPSPTPGELGRNTLAICEAIAQSGETRRFVKVRSIC